MYNLLFQCWLFEHHSANNFTRHQRLSHSPSRMKNEFRNLHNQVSIYRDTKRLENKKNEDSSLQADFIPRQIGLYMSSSNKISTMVMSSLEITQQAIMCAALRSSLLFLSSRIYSDGQSLFYKTIRRMRISSTSPKPSSCATFLLLCPWLCFSKFSHGWFALHTIDRFR